MGFTFKVCLTSMNTLGIFQRVAFCFGFVGMSKPDTIELCIA